MRLCTLCLRLNLDAMYPRDVNVCRECEVERQGSPDVLVPADFTLEQFVAGSRWTIAKTMLDRPHEYTVRDLTTEDARKTTCLSHSSFEWFAERCQEEGREEMWGGRTYRYLEVGGYEYWTMGLMPVFTTIINRRPVSEEAKAAVQELVDQARASRR